jgi:hypothetical protein
MRFKISAFLIALVCLCSLSIGAAPVPEIVFQASFSGARLDGLTRPTTVGEWRGDTVDGSGNLLDVSGQNNVKYADDWTSVRSTKSLNSYNNPIDGLKTAMAIVEDATAGDSHGIYVGSISGSTTLMNVYSAYIKPIGRTWCYISIADAVTRSAYFNLSGNGAVGTTANVAAYGIRRSSNGFYRVWIASPLTTATGRELYILGASGNGGALYNGVLGSDSIGVYGAQWETVRSGETRTTPGMFKPTTTVTKPLYDMTQTNNPSVIQSSLQSLDGNRLLAQSYNGTNQRHYNSSIGSTNILKTPHTVTVVYRSKSTDISSLLSNYTTGGYDLTEGELVYYNSGGGTKKVTFTPSYNGQVRIFQETLSNSNISSVYINGVASIPVDVTGYLYANATISFGTDHVGNYGAYEVLYVRIDNEVLSTTRLAEERDIIRGIASNRSKESAWLFSRSSTAYQPNSAGGISLVAINAPRVSGEGGGIFLEGSSTNYCLQSQTLGTTWTQTALTSVSSDGAVAPDGTTTMDGSVGTAVDTQHGFSQAVTTTAAKWTFSIYATAGDKNWIYLSNSTIANAYAYFDIVAGRVGTVGAGATGRMYQWGNGYRCEITMTATAASNTFQAYSANADADNDFAGDASTVNTWWWGGQVEQSEFATSYIATTTGGVGRGGDYLRMTSNIGIPIVSNTSAMTKIKINLEVKSPNPTLAWPGDTYGSLFQLEFGANEYLSVYAYRTLGYGLYYSGSGDGGAIKQLLSSNMGNRNAWNTIEVYFDSVTITNSYIMVNGTKYFSWFSTPTSHGFSAPASALYIGTMQGTWSFAGSVRNFRVQVY